jgi:hypothetical protein
MIFSASVNTKSVWKRRAAGRSLPTDYQLRKVYAM